ncbi:MAG: monovalent cation/H+ antiporter subunit D family protein [bacterium]|nr:monovalent cation/H+ antiporter subunit D family protein [bacterium]
MVIQSFTPLFAMLSSLVAVFPITLLKQSENRREMWTFIAAIIKFALVISMVPIILGGQTIELTLVSLIPNVPLKLRVDGFGMVFALVASSLWIVTSIYSIGYMRKSKEHAQSRFFACFALALFATLGVAFSANLLTMYIFYEILSLSTYPLVAHHQDKEAKIGGRKYLTYLLGTSIGLALPAMLIIYNITGTLDFGPNGIMAGHELGKLLPVLVLMFMYGFGKAGLMPLHAWLPGAMVAPTPVSSLLHAVAVVKVGVFCVIRVITGIFGANYLTLHGMVPLICYVAGFTVITASLMALYQDNLKRRLAFSTIGQLAYIIMGVGLCSYLGIVGGVAHIAMHAFGKITLFFCAGAIYVATGKKYISQMVGIGKRMPITMAAFFIGSLSVIGFPPTGGLVSKLYMLRGALQADMIPIVVIYLVSSFLNACYFLPIVYKAFFCTDSESQYEDKINEAPLACIIPPVITACVTIALFIYPNLVINLVESAMGVL